MIGDYRYPICQGGGMRLAELSARSGLSTATVKYYLRSGLLPPGTVQSSTWATYDDGHLR
ncbi:MAG: MerR family transcriptional regulator, partial [Pseudonocardiaceae bacterium]